MFTLSGVAATMPPPPAPGPDELWRQTARLIAGAPVVRLAQRRAGGKVAYPTSYERALTGTLPTAPAAVRVYGPDGRCATLCLDLDAKGAHTSDDVERDYAHLTRMLDILGVVHLGDLSPAGGRHLYIPLADRLDLESAREIVQALAIRFTSIDASPHNSARTGCIRTPGSAHAHGGHQELDGTLDAAIGALVLRNDADALDALTGSLNLEMEAVRAQRAAITLVPEHPGTGTRAAAISPQATLSPRMTAIAVDGHLQGYHSGSEARQAVLTACAGAGWALTDVQARIHDGRWPGLASMYARYTPARRLVSLRYDWDKASTYAASRLATAPNDSVRISDTSAFSTHGGVDDHGFIRTWRSVMVTYERSRLRGRAHLYTRMVLRALAESAHKAGSTQLAFGCRSLAVAAGIDHSTVAAALKTLTAAGWIDLLEPARGEHADTYALTIPADLHVEAAAAQWERGKIHAMRPAFRILGVGAAFVFEAVEHRRANDVASLIAMTGLSRSSVHESVGMLSAWGLVTTTESGMVAHPELLDVVAERLGAGDLMVAQIARYRAERAAWRAWLARFEGIDELFDDDPFQSFAPVLFEVA